MFMIRAKAAHYSRQRQSDVFADRCKEACPKRIACCGNGKGAVRRHWPTSYLGGELCSVARIIAEEDRAVPWERRRVAE